MPAPQHTRLSFSGVIGSTGAPAEIWSCNLNATDPGGPFLTKANLVTLAAGLATDWQTTAQTMYSGQVVLTRVRAAAVMNDGHVQRDASGAYIQGDWTGQGVNAVTTYVPPQIALTLTLHTAASGPTGRGRIFLPCPAYGALGIDGRMATGTRDALQTKAVTLLNALNARLNTASAGTRLCVASGGSITRGIAPALRPLTGVSVGRVLDTQRRRREDLQEERVISVLA